MTRTLALAALLLPACAAHGSAPAAIATSPAPGGARPAASPPVETTGPAGDATPPDPPPPGTPERARAVERCRQAFGDLARTTTPPDPTDLWRACADVFREPCAAAMRSAPTDPATFASATARACRDTYCPRLPAPRPRLCAGAELPPPTELLPQWGELQARVWGLELGIDPKSIEPMFRASVVPVPQALPSASTAPTTVHVYAKPEGAGRVRVWVGDGKGMVGREDELGDAMVTLAREARAAATADAQVVFRVDKNVSYGAVVGLIDAFKREGFHRFAFAVVPAAAK